ncbi:class I adenylate-forming enzyme family protein [Lactococcus garvieae]|uniref:class I adenylate-forming enzyme family protein n=1 Tax=Lactococcus garvieae TaxID=1363 RepID=UPI0022DEBDAD|nr:acyl-CoA synthetase [Lactococcus garvieae]
MKFNHKPLNLYVNFKESAEKFPKSRFIFDKKLNAFPELELETSYQSVHEAVLQKAYNLAALGIKKEDKVIIFKSSAFDTYLLAVAVSYLGAVPAMISHHFSSPVMDTLAARLETPWLIFDEDTASVVQELNNVKEDHKLFVSDFASLTNSPEVSNQQLATDEIAYLTHTSGTTGIPKLIAHSAQSMGWRWVLQRTVMDWMPDKSSLLAFHISPVHSRFNIGISSAMTFGFDLMPLSNLEKNTVLSMFDKYRPTAFETHPNHFVRLANVVKETPEAFASIRYLHSTFDAINKDTMHTFLAASQEENPVFLQIYGQSECGPMIWKKHRLSTLPTTNAREMGIGMPGLSQARVTDADGNVLPAGTPGHIHFLSKGRALTYYKEDSRFAEEVYGDWWDTGDWGIMDEDGVLFLYDRQVDLIDKVESNLAIEDLLLDQHDFLDEVIIIRDAAGHPQPILALAEGKEMDWKAWWFSIIDMPFLNEPLLMDYDAIPRTATMKVQRLALERELAAAKK